MPSSRSPLWLTFLISSTASGACPASLRAHASAVSNSSWSGTTRLTSPCSSASCAVIASPMRFISSALWGPTRRGSRCVPPNPGMIPSLISGWPKIADSAAMRKSHAIESSQPPPKASELTAAIVETRFWPRSRRSAWPEWIRSSPPASSICVNALMSAPAEKTTRDRGGDHHRADLVRRLDLLPHGAEVLDDVRRDRVHQRVREPGDRDVAACLELDRVGLVALVGLRVGVEALARLLAEAALRDEALERDRRREALAVLLLGRLELLEDHVEARRGRPS